MTVTGKRLVLRLDTDYSETVTITDEDGDAIDVTNDTIKCLIKNSSGTAVLTLTVDDGITITNGTAGIITIDYAQADIASIAAGAYRRYLLLAHSGSDRLVLESECYVLASVGSV